MKNQILTEIRQMLGERADQAVRESSAKFFKGKEEFLSYGVKSHEVGKIAKAVWQSAKTLPKQTLFELCEELWKSGYQEEAGIACAFSEAVHKQFEPADFRVFERWVQNYVDNWAKCDTLCNHTVGTFIEMYPTHVAELKRWATSANRWMRRAAAVTLIIPARKGLFLRDVLEIADVLLLDSDDMVQKGYGWMLKAASMSERFGPNADAKYDPETRREHLEAVFDFVIKRRTVMPRTALRYAIEKMPPAMRTEAMK